jgi:acyl carrier protein
MPTPEEITRDVRSILKEHARLAVDIATLADDADLYQAGMTSHASVNLMLALEDKFEVEFPERMLRRRAFENVAAIRSAIEELTAGR